MKGENGGRDQSKEVKDSPSVSGRENEGKDVGGDYPQREDVHRGEQHGVGELPDKL